MKEEDTRKICEKCVYYNDCYYDHDCKAMELIKMIVDHVIEYENLDYSNPDY